MSVNPNSKIPSLELACKVLNDFDVANNNKIIEVESNNIKIQNRACWCSRIIRRILRFFTCGSTHPVEKVAKRLLDIFASNLDQINQTHHEAIFKLSFLMGKAQISTKTKSRFGLFCKLVFKEEASIKSKEADLLQEANRKNEAVEKELKQKESELESGYQAKIAGLKDTIRAEMTEEFSKAAHNIASLIADAEADGKAIQSKASERQWPLTRFSPLLDLSSIMNKAKDTVFICKGFKEVSFHRDLLETSKNVKVANTKASGVREIDLQDFSFETVTRLQKLLYKGQIDDSTTLEQLCDLCRLCSFIGNKKLFDAIEAEIGRLANKTPELIFEVLPTLNKHHPAVNQLGNQLIKFSLWNNASEIPLEKKERLLKWILECEEQQYEKLRNESHMITPLIAYAYRGDLGRVKSWDKTYKLLREYYDRTDGKGGSYYSVITFLWLCLLKGIGAPKLENHDFPNKLLKILWEANQAEVKYFVGIFALRGEHGVKMAEEEAYKLINGHDYPLAGYEAGKYDLEKRKKIWSAEYHFQRGMEVGHLESMTSFGVLNVRPGLSDSAKEKGFDCIIKAARRGDKEAQFILGRTYQQVYEKRQQFLDKATATIWYQKAADQGYPEAIKALAQLN